MTGRRVPRRSRAQSPVVTDGRIDAVLPPGMLRVLLEAFKKDLYRRPGRIPAGITDCGRAYFRFLFSLVVDAGIAGPEAWKEICSLRFRNLDQLHVGYLTLPRRGAEVPIPLGPTVLACAASLGLHLMRGRSPSGRFLSEYPPDGYLFPDRPDPVSPPKPDELRAVQARFLDWLVEYSDSPRRRITFNQLCALSRVRLSRTCHCIVSGTLLGLHQSNPIPVDQCASLAALLGQSDAGGDHVLPHPVKGRTCRPRPGILGKGKRKPRPRKKKPMTEWDQALTPLRRLLRPYIQAGKERARLLKPVIAARLDRYVRTGARSIGRRDGETWRDFTIRLPSAELRKKRSRLNSLLVADWMSFLIRRYPPNTVGARFQDLVTVLRVLPDYPCKEMDTALGSLRGLRVSTSSRLRFLDSLRMFTRHLEDNHGFPERKFPWWILRGRRELRMQRLPGRRDLQALLADLPATDPMIRTLRCGIFLILWFGLRLSEVCRLQLGDVRLEGIPTVFVWNSKGGASRWVECDDVPEDVMAELRVHHSGRAAESGGNASAPFLVIPNGRPLSRGVFDRRVGTSMRHCDFPIFCGREARPAHILRHACANRWWWEGVPVVDVARRLGHKSLDTTIGHYLHAVSAMPLPDADQAAAPVRPPSVSGMAALYGTSRRAVYHKRKATVPGNSGKDSPGSIFLSILQGLEGRERIH